MNGLIIGLIAYIVAPPSAVSHPVALPTP